MADACECGGLEFDEYRVALNVSFLKGATGTSGQKVYPGEIKQRDVWTRFCKHCNRVSLWSKSSA